MEDRQVMTVEELALLARRLRRTAMEAMIGAGSAHFGGSLSPIEILTALYFGVMRVDPANPSWPDRDRFVLAKGHGGPGLYPVLAERGYFPKEMLSELDKPGGRLPKHVDRLKCPGIEVSTGCMGQGLSTAVGMAIAGKHDKRDYTVYVLTGDGELDSGQVWEAAMCAAKYGLDNLVAIIDRNQIQLDGWTDRNEKVMPLEPLADKWRAFGWHVLEADGHDMGDLMAALRLAKSAKGKPAVIIAHTVKGKGVSFMESATIWHHSGISGEQAEQALKELERAEVAVDA